MPALVKIISRFRFLDQSFRKDPILHHFAQESMQFSRRTLLGVVVAATVSATASLHAQVVEFAGATSGCFYTTGSCTPVSPATLLLLQFSAGTFDVNTSRGFASIGGSTTNLGTMTLGGSADNYSALGENFLLDVTFAVPYIVGSNAYYTAAVQGSVTDDGAGGINISFANNQQTFYYNGPTYGGSFTLAVNNISVTPGAGPQAISGYIRTTVAPEPAALGLLGTGLVGLIPMVRRRQRG